MTSIQCAWRFKIFWSSVYFCRVINCNEEVFSVTFLDTLTKSDEDPSTLFSLAIEGLLHLLCLGNWSPDVHVTVHRVKFLIIKPTRCTHFSIFFLEWKSTCFGQFLCPSSGVFHCTHSNGICHRGLLTACEQEHMLLLASCQQTCMTYTIAVCTVKNSWWWTEELSETCRVSFQE